jgi:hypothetical protein
MANEVSYFDETTMTKVLKALHGENDLDFTQTLDAVNRLQNAGILFREAARRDKPAAKANGDEEKNVFAPSETPDPTQ